ncbi:MAG TPA: hypothetical protein VFX38_08705 [Gammaproteobacteria bacterium]|nr:hypothetical protein [Gammaproteobacteria bacterium]
MNRISALALGLLAAAFWTHSAVAADGSDTSQAKTLSRTVDAAGLASVRLDADVGSITVRAGKTNTVHVEATASPANHGHFIFDWTFGPPVNELPPDLRLVTARRGTELVICLASSTSGCKAVTEAAEEATAGSGHRRVTVVAPGGGFHVEYGGDSNTAWKADWTLVVPARLALELRSGVGSADISGVGGGLQAHIGVGKVDAVLPRGPVSVNVGVGDADITVASPDYGSVHLAAGVGDVSFEVNGNKNTTGYDHQFTAASQELDGPGGPAYTLKAGVGHVKLALGEHAGPHSAEGAQNGADDDAP